MHHTQPTTPSALTTPVFAADVPMQLPDPDYAFGCECADPRLTIEMWNADAGGAIAAAAEPQH